MWQQCIFVGLLHWRRTRDATAGGGKYHGAIDETGQPSLAERCQHESSRSLINMLINRPRRFSGVPSVERYL